MGQDIALYAQEFPDLLDVLNSFTPLVLIDIFAIASSNSVLLWS